MAFHLGSLGFLTPFKFDTYQTQVTQIIEGTCAGTRGITTSFTLNCLQSVFSSFRTLKESLVCILRHAGNAAIVLRSRLKVRVMKANMEKKARVDEKGIILTNGDVESSWKAVQYQVTRVKTTASTFHRVTLRRRGTNKTCRLKPRILLRRAGCKRTSQI